MPALPVPRLADHLESETVPSDEEGGKEAKREKSEAQSRLLLSLLLADPQASDDEVMGITQVDSREAERSEEGLDSGFHDVAEELPDITTNKPDPGHASCFSQGGYGNSSLQECLDLLNQAKSNSPAPCHSRAEIGKTSNPPQVMSPNVEEEQTYGRGQASGSLPEGHLSPEDEPQSRRKEEIKDEEVTPKLEPTAVETKEESSEQDVGDQDSDALREELQRSRDEFPPHDSEDSLGPEHVAESMLMSSEGSSRNTHQLIEGSAPPREPREGATAPDVAWENHGPYAPQRSRRHRGQPVSPDPFMFHTTIWLEHDSEASARVHEEPIEQLRDRVRTVEANLETLRTRSTQVAELRDAQGLREGHRALIARLTEIEECASAHTVREFMTKILRLESLVCGEQGGIVGEAIRASGFRTGIMTCLNKKMTKRHNSLQLTTPMLRINQEWRIAHLEGVELEDRRHSADFRDQFLDHHHHKHKVQMRQQH